MTSVLIVGGTGLVGHQVALECQRRGHTTRVLSRHQLAPNLPRSVPGVEYITADVTDGSGVREAMAGVDVVIDVLDGRFGMAQRALDDGVLNLLAAARAAGTPRAVMLSIVNADRVNFPYHRAKVRQEKIYLNSVVPSVVVRATQFHDLVTSVFDGGRRVGIVPVFRAAAFQPIAVQDVAGALVDAATQKVASNGPVDVAGPAILDMAELARLYREVTGADGRVVTMPLPGAVGRFFSNGDNLARDAAVDGLSYEDWLRQRPR